MGKNLFLRDCKVFIGMTLEFDFYYFFEIQFSFIKLVAKLLYLLQYIIGFQVIKKDFILTR